MANSTQSILEEGYRMLEAKLRALAARMQEHSNAEANTLAALAEELGLAAALPEQDRETVQSVAWRPVAQTCIVSMVRLLLDRPAVEKWVVSESDMIGLGRSLETPEFARRLGLCLDDTKFAVRLTVQVIGDLFERARRLTMDGRSYSVARVPAGLSVELQRNLSDDCRSAR